MSKRKATHNLSNLNEDGEFVPSNSTTAAHISTSKNKLLTNIENTAGSSGARVTMQAPASDDHEFAPPTAFAEKRSKKKSLSGFNASQIVDDFAPATQATQAGRSSEAGVSIKASFFFFVAFLIFYCH
jgi:hypothetical protein